MPQYEVYATRFDALGVIEAIPARDLSFSLPLSDHGECSFTATVGPGDTMWRQAVALPFSGVLVTRDNVPYWSGMIVGEPQQSARGFQFTCREWGWVFEEKIPAVPNQWRNVNDHVIFRALVTQAQLIQGQNFMVEVGNTLGDATSDRVVAAWDDTTVGREFRSISDAIGGPEWYFGTAGTIDAPRRQLILGDRLGHTTARSVLEYVEDSAAVRRLDAPPSMSLLSDLYPAAPPVQAPRRAGGNVLSVSRTRSLAEAATVVVASGAGDTNAQIRESATASTLLARGWPRMTVRIAYPDVTDRATLKRHAQAELARRAGIATGYSLVTLDGDGSADWAMTPRGSTVRVVLDTDVYGADRPVGGADGFEARLLDTVVRVPDSGEATVEWKLAEVLEVS